jgi:hypothetical protein
VPPGEIRGSSDDSEAHSVSLRNAYCLGRLYSRTFPGRASSIAAFLRCNRSFIPPKSDFPEEYRMHNDPNWSSSAGPWEAHSPTTGDSMSRSRPIIRSITQAMRS